MNQRQELAAHWPILATCICGVMLGVGALPTYSLGLVAKPLEAALHWQVADVMTTLPFQAAGMAIGIPIAGMLSDRIHPRPLALVAAFALVLMFLALPFAAERGLWQFRAVYFVMGLLTAGTSGLFYTRVVTDLFHSARGLALGLTLAGTGITTFLLPYYVHAMIGHWGWRSVYFGIAGIILCVSVPVLFFGFRRAPMPRPASGAAPAQDGLPLSGALRDARFYLMIASLMLLGAMIGSLMVDIVPALIDRGVDVVRAGQIASLLGISVIAGRIGSGWLLDRFRPSHVGIAIFLSAAAGSYAFTASGVWGATIAVIAIGVLNGAEIDLVSFMVARYFGVRHYGRIFGFCYAAYMAVSVGGPFVGAALIRSEGHDLLFLTTSVTFLIATAGFALLSRIEGAPFEAGETARHPTATPHRPADQGV